MSPRVAKGHFALHLPWELVLQGGFEAGGGLECGYEDDDQLESQGHHRWCVRVRSGPMGGGGRGGARRPGDSVIVPCFKHLARLIGVGGVQVGRW